MHESQQAATFAVLHAAGAMASGVKLFDVLQSGHKVELYSPREGTWYATVSTTITKREFQAETFSGLADLIHNYVTGL